MVGGSLRVLPASSTTKTGRHDITEILLKVALNTIKTKKIKGFTVATITKLTFAEHHMLRFSESQPDPFLIHDLSSGL